MQPGDKPCKLERSVTERYRRMQMNDLLSTLFSLIQTKPTTKTFIVPELLDGATAYVKELQTNVESLKKLKEKLKYNQPVFEVKDMGSTVIVNLITGLDKKLMLPQVLNILKEEGAEVVNASYSTEGGRIFYTIYCQAFMSRIGVEVSSVHQRLMQLLFSTT